MLRIHVMQQWFSLSDPGMEEAFFDVPLYREFARLEDYARLPDESTILRFRHRLEQHQLAEQILTTVNQLLTQQGLLLKVGSVVDARCCLWGSVGAINLPIAAHGRTWFICSRNSRLRVRLRLKLLLRPDEVLKPFGLSLSKPMCPSIFSGRTDFI